MKEEKIRAEDFFMDFDQQERVPLVRGSDHKTKSSGLLTFEDTKVKMVMRIEGCGREEAVRLIEERSAELLAKENANKDVRTFG